MAPRKRKTSKADERASVKVAIPGPDQDRPGWKRVVVFAAVGLAIGVAWPRVAGVRIGPEVPGAKRGQFTAEPAAAAVSGQPAASASAAAGAPAASTRSAPLTNKQTVVVSGGEITRCWHRKKKLAPEECGALRIDKLLAPRLKQLAGCPSALGLRGELEIGFDLDFNKKEISVIQGKKSDLPGSTVQGIIACVADYIGDLEPEKIAHKYSRYRVSYELSFYPPGAAPSAAGDAEEASAEAESDAARGLAAVSWDTALVRDEPRTGKVIARLVRGTRVKILGRRKDWYRVKIRSQEGWVYRGALGL